MNIFIRTDASIDIGTGHVTRCLTLADGLKKKDAAISFICRKESGNLIEYIENKGYRVNPLPTNIDILADRDLTQKILQEQQKPTDWMIIDHYEIDASWESTLRKFVKKIMVIDDLANRKHDCDILLGQNYSGNHNRYNGLVPRHCIQLLGPEYALLRPQFREARESLRERDGEIKRILVFMGGADPFNETCKALRGIQMLDRHDIAVDVVTGASNPNRDEVEKLASLISGTTFYCNVNNMAELMAAADLCVGAGGTSTWERCCLGLPVIAMILAENQRKTVEDIERTGIGINLGRHEGVKKSDIKSSIDYLLKNPEKVRGMSLRAMEIVDGRGTDRVSRELLEV